MKSLFTVFFILAFSTQLSAEEMSRGEIAGIIRSAEHPCSNVLDFKSIGENSWNVVCNSGSFIVIRETDGKFIVQSTEKK